MGALKKGGDWNPFTNYGQCCGYWGKIEKNNFFLQNDHLFTKGVKSFQETFILVSYNER